jgi:cytochrome c oxidase subunit 3
MPTSDRKLRLLKRKPVIQRIEQLHPHKLLNYLIIAASCMMYLFLIISFLQFSQVDFALPGADHYPKFFSISAIIMSVSLIFSTRIKEAYLNDQVKYLRVLLSSLLITGLVFIIVQSLGWLELLSSESPARIQKFQSYLFLFSGMHMLHVVAGVVMLGLLFYRITTIEGDPVKSIVMLTNPYEKIKLEIFTTLWHYAVISWLIIYTFFLLIF